MRDIMSAAQKNFNHFDLALRLEIPDRSGQLSLRRNIVHPLNCAVRAARGRPVLHPKSANGHFSCCARASHSSEFQMFCIVG
jgi:hypothetical protein